MSQKILAGIGFMAIALFVAVLIVVNVGSGDIQNTEPVNNVRVVDGIQIIEIGAKGGYSPRLTIAQAGIPTVIHFITKGTFDCSSVVRIPSLDITKNLPQSGTTDINIGSTKAGTLKGSCGMGMYPFEIEFKT